MTQRQIFMKRLAEKKRHAVKMCHAHDRLVIAAGLRKTFIDFYIADHQVITALQQRIRALEQRLLRA